MKFFRDVSGRRSAESYICLCDDGVIEVESIKQVQEGSEGQEIDKEEIEEKNETQT